MTRFIILTFLLTLATVSLGVPTSALSPERKLPFSALSRTPKQAPLPPGFDLTPSLGNKASSVDAVLHSDRGSATFEVLRTPKPVAAASSSIGVTPFDGQILALDAILTNPVLVTAGRDRRQRRLSSHLHISVRQSGLSGDPCTSSSQCAGSRVCSTREMRGARRCILPSGVQECSKDDSCVTGEVCITSNEIDKSGCISAATAAEIRGKGTPSVASSGGFTGDKCSSNADCVGTRVCIDFSGSKRCVPPAGLSHCNSGADCPFEGCLTVFATEEKYCSSEGFAGEVGGEVTVTVTNLTPTPRPVGESGSTGAAGGNDREEDPPEGDATVPHRPTTTGPSGSSSLDSGDGVDDEPSSGEDESDSSGASAEAAGSGDTPNTACIAVSWLRHLPREELVFKDDVLARVLCDGYGSCATGGHMVIHAGAVMMMKSYCEREGCVERVMLVNSPRYFRGFRADSGGGMVFTAFAARYGTMAEEGLLRVVVGLGF